jgi:hypothetical protein
MLRIAAILLAIAWAAVAGSLPMDGEALFRQCEFKAAAHAFEHALTNQPQRADPLLARQVLCANGRGVWPVVGTQERA